LFGESVRKLDIFADCDQLGSRNKLIVIPSRLQMASRIVASSVRGSGG
jgi:hypothetical protein